MSWLLIVGAKSDIAKAVAHKFASKGYNIYLAGRNTKEIEKDATDIAYRYGIQTRALELDILKFSTHEKFYKSLNEKPEGVIVAAGYLGDHDLALREFKESEKIIHTNYTGPVSLLNIIARDFEIRGSGTIAGISSVAGDRGRHSNYIYGSSKAAFTAYLSGMRQRLVKKGVHVLTIKPGFVNTQMTAELDLPQNLTAEPEEVANDIYNAYRKGADVVYTRWVWRYIMMIITGIPEMIFKKTSI